MKTMIERERRLAFWEGSGRTTQLSSISRGLLTTPPTISKTLTVTHSDKTADEIRGNEYNNYKKILSNTGHTVVYHQRCKATHLTPESLEEERLKLLHQGIKNSPVVKFCRRVWKLRQNPRLARVNLFDKRHDGDHTFASHSLSVRLFANIYRSCLFPRNLLSGVSPLSQVFILVRFNVDDVEEINRFTEDRSRRYRSVMRDVCLFTLLGVVFWSKKIYFEIGWKLMTVISCTFAKNF